MTTYTPARAREILPAGGTRLHRAILKGDTEAMLGWIEAGADPWAMSAYLPDNLRTRLWGSEQRFGGVKLPKGPSDLSAIALAVLLVTEATWPAVQALLARTDLTQDKEGWVFEAATLSKRPPTPEQVAHARWRQVVLPAHRPDDLWTTLLAHGLRPPIQDRLPSANYTSKHSALAGLRTEWRQAMEAHLGLPLLGSLFKPGCSPLDRDPPRKGAGAIWGPWIEGGMPMAHPQATLLTWVEHAPYGTTEAEFTTVVQALVARGARLDQPLAQEGVAEPYWPTPSGQALERGFAQRAAWLQQLQGRTLVDEAGAMGSWTPAVEAAGRNLTAYPAPLRFSGLLRAVEDGLDPLALGPTAKGWHALLAQLQESQPRDLREVHQPFQSWLSIAQELKVPATGWESGRPYAMVETYMDRLAQKLTRHLNLGTGLGLTEDVARLAQYAGQAVADLAQAQLHRLAAQGNPMACAIWAPALLKHGARWEVTGPDGQSPSHHLTQDLSPLLGLERDHLKPALRLLAQSGVDPWTLDGTGQTLWDRWPHDHRLTVLAAQEDIELKLTANWESARLNGLDRRLLQAMMANGVAGWFTVPVTPAYSAPRGPLTHLERWASVDKDLSPMLPSAASLAGHSPLERNTALLPFMVQVAERGFSPLPEWAMGIEFLTSEVRRTDLSQRPAQAPVRPRRRI